MPAEETAHSGDGAAQPGGKRQLRYYFLRPEFDAASRPRLERSEGGRAERRVAKKKWDREEGGRFQTWVYIAALVVIVGIWALLIFR